jgi:hypothetical protein
MRITTVGLAAIFLAIGAPTAFAKDSAAAPPTVGGGHMEHCPTAVTGAKTTITETKDAVVITVTGDSDEIRKRAKHVVEAAKQDPASVVHDGSGHGGGGLGRCEIVMKDTTVIAEDVDGGSKITVKPVKPVDFEWLKKETHTRHVANASGTGGGKKKPAATKASN